MHGVAWDVLAKTPLWVAVLVGLVLLAGAVWLGRRLERGSAMVLHGTQDTWAALQRNAIDGERVPGPPPVLRPGVGLTPKRKAEGAA